MSNQLTIITMTDKHITNYAFCHSKTEAAEIIQREYEEKRRNSTLKIGSRSHCSHDKAVLVEYHPLLNNHITEWHVIGCVSNKSDKIFTFQITYGYDDNPHCEIKFNAKSLDEALLLWKAFSSTALKHRILTTHKIEVVFDNYYKEKYGDDYGTPEDYEQNRKI